MQDPFGLDDLPPDSLGLVWAETRHGLKGLERLDDLMSTRRTQNHAFALPVLGPPRCGKTTLVKEWVRLCGDSEGGRSPIKALYVQLKSDTKPSSIAYETLCKLKDPNPGYGTPQQRTTRVVNAIGDHGYDVVIYDEAHRLIDSETKKVQEKGAGWVNDLLHDCRVPIVLIGSELVLDVMERDKSFGGRMFRFPVFRPYDHTDADDLNEFCHVLACLEEALGFKTASHLDAPGTAARICYVCLGRLGLLESFLTQARLLARRLRHSCLTVGVLSEVAAEVGPGWERGAINPFAVEDLQAALEAAPRDAVGRLKRNPRI